MPVYLQYILWHTESLLHFGLGMLAIGPICPRDLGHFRERGKNQAPAYSVSDKGPYDRLESKRCSNMTMDFDRWYNPSQAYTVEHVSNQQLTATIMVLLSVAILVLLPVALLILIPVTFLVLSPDALLVMLSVVLPAMWPVPMPAALRV